MTMKSISLRGRRFTHCLLARLTPMDNKLGEFLNFARQHAVVRESVSKNVVQDVSTVVPLVKLASLIARFKFTNSENSKNFETHLIRSLSTLEDPIRAIVSENNPIHLTLGRVRVLHPFGGPRPINECETMVVHPMVNEESARLGKVFDTILTSLKEKNVLRSERRGANLDLLSGMAIMKGRQSSGWHSINFGDILSHEGMRQFQPPGAGPIDLETVFGETSSQACPELDLGTFKVSDISLKPITGWTPGDVPSLYEIKL